MDEASQSARQPQGPGLVMARIGGRNQHFDAFEMPIARGVGQSPVGIVGSSDALRRQQLRHARGEALACRHPQGQAPVSQARSLAQQLLEPMKAGLGGT